MTGETFNHVEPAWLTAALDQRIAQLKEAVGDVLDESDYAAIVLSLTDPPPTLEAIKRWEQSCDHCDRHLPDGGLLVGNATRAFNDHVVIELVFAACHDCAVSP